MRVKQSIHLFSLVSLFSILGFLFLSSPPAYAYTCAYSGPSGNGTKGQYKLQMEGDGGNCYYMQPDSKDNSKRVAVIDTTTGQATGQYKCTGGTVMHSDGDCWTYKKTYTGYKPTYDDGSQIPDQVFQNACQDQGTYYGSHYNYDSKLNACSAGLGCIDGIGDSGASNSTSGGTGLPILGDCRRVGVDTKTAGDVVGDDPTTAKVQECTNAGAEFNAQSHQCDWTQQTCPNKNSGQGIWVNGQCKAYSDYTNKDDCVKAGGDFKQDPKDSTHWECVKPGTDVNGNGNCSKNSQSSDCVVDGANGNVGDPVEGSCGHRGENPNDVIKTNLISCDTSGDAYQVLGDVLKIGVRVLTVLVGIAAVAGIVWESLQYARAQDDQSIVSHARDRIRDIVIGLFVYGFMIAIINWLVPGGVIQ